MMAYTRDGAFLSSDRPWLGYGELARRRARYVSRMVALRRRHSAWQVVLEVHFPRVRLVEAVALVGLWCYVAPLN